MGASPIARHVYQVHLKYFGEPDQSIIFENDNAPAAHPSRIDILVWKASAEIPITTFSTIGMATRPMVGANHRAELHFSIRRSLDRTEIAETSKFLANLAMHPFTAATYFDWWHKVRDPGVIPLYTQAASVLFHPKFVETGWDVVEFEPTQIRILNVVPITTSEYEMQLISGLQDHWAEIGIDLFEPR